jgi:dimethylamine monooxygenase subunit A
MPDANARLTWTSVPRWPAPELPPAASYLACCFGETAGERAESLLAGADPGIPVRRAALAARWDVEEEAELRRLINACHTGVRIILTGPESVVRQAMAVARELGASADEIVPFVIEAAAHSPQRRVFCAACRRSFDAVAEIGGRVACPVCAAELTVNPRFSGPQAAYFGWPTGLDLHQ